MVLPSLPLDILEQVVYEGTEGARDHQQLMKFCRVCSVWRELILSSPNLWTYLDFQGQQTEYIDFCFQNAHPLPLSINIQLQKITNFHTFTLIFNKYIKRITKIGIWTLCPPTHTWNEIGSNLLSGTLSDLKFKAFERFHATRSLLPPGPLKTDITIIPFELDFSTLAPLPWSSITHLDLDHYPVDHAFQLVINCPSLTFFSCLAVAPSQWSLTEIQTKLIITNTILKNLHTLIWRCPDTFWNTIFVTFRFPELRILHWNNTMAALGISSFISAMTKLESLTLYYGTLEGELENSTLDVLDKTLRVLSIHNYGVGPSQFIELTRYLSQRLPLLKQLGIRTKNMEFRDMGRNPIVDAVVELAKARKFERFVWEYKDDLGPLLESQTEVDANVEMVWIGPSEW